MSISLPPETDHAAAAQHGTWGSYTAGLALSILLTAGSFAAVMTDQLPSEVRLPAIVLLCVVQLFVQLIFFLHLGSAKSQRQNTAIFACTIFLMAVVVAGSLWVMHNANINMMPMSMSVQDAIHRQ